MKLEELDNTFKFWEEKYEIPIDKIFQVLALIKLQEKFDKIMELSGDNTDLLAKLLKMINDLDSNLNLKKKETLISNIDILLVTGSSYEKNKHIAELFKMFTKDSVLEVVYSKFITIIFKNGLSLKIVNKDYIMQNSHSIRGMKVTEYINLTGDDVVEDILRTLF